MVKDLVGKYGEIGELFRTMTADDMIGGPTHTNSNIINGVYRWMEDTGYHCWSINKDIKRAFFSKMGMSYDDNMKINEDYAGEIEIPVHYTGGNNE